MSESIFSTTPSNNDVAGGSPITLGTVWTPSVNGTVTNLRQYLPANNAVGAVGVLYSWTSNSTGVELGRQAYTGLVDDAWNTTPALASPIAVTAGSFYVAATYFPNGHYVVTPAGLASAVISGHLTAVADGVKTNGKFHDGADAYPGDTFNSNCYFADVVFTATPTTTTGTAAAALGRLVAAASGKSTVLGTAVADLGFLTANALVALAKGNNPRITSTSSGERITSTSGGGRL